MELIPEYLDILYRKVQPEMLLDNIENEYVTQKKNMFRLDSWNISMETFRHYSYKNFEGYSADEIENLYYNMLNYMTIGKSRMKSSVFNIIPHYMEDIVDIYGQIPRCRSKEILNWRSSSLRLGQDTLLMSYMAYMDYKNNYVRNFFAWNSTIASDNVRLQNLLKRGIAENHFHLYGSTMVFPLSWISLMNHPQKIAEYFRNGKIRRKMSENLTDSVMLGEVDNQMEWTKRLTIACWIRKELYKSIKVLRNNQQTRMAEELIAYVHFPLAGRLADEVNALRYSYGYRFRQPDFYDGVCLDYAINLEHGIKDEFRHNASLIGERKFLYDCYYRSYNGQFSKDEQDVFYLYLLIKSQFRNELIQVNQRVGFKNFARYQNRKGDFWWNTKEYAYEAHVLALKGAFSGQSIKSLEARIMPSDRWTKDIEGIFAIDRDMYFANKGQSLPADNVIKEIKQNGINEKYFFVIHFPKIKLERINARDSNKELIGIPRNYKTREKAERFAKAIKKAIVKNNYYANRVWGIDACSTEIGCRPETFATEFRFLRYIVCSENVFWEGKSREKRLWITYHAGEDFLDIVDGIRAIDEAVRFLDMNNRDRLGHALALGVDPEAYYLLKRRNLIMPKQDVLDNYVWLLFRSLELGVMIDSQLRCHMEYEAEKLFHYIYPPSSGNDASLKDYFESWKLRGDHPQLYRSGEYIKKEDIFTDDYKEAGTLKDEKLKLLRGQKQIAYLYYRYHFGAQERRCGQEMQIVEITDEYIALAKEMQKSIQRLLMEKSIAIECNPSSNVLIGTFKRYDTHPMLQFNSYALNKHGKYDPVQLNISINTDDQGVFDTLLENEYALMACALEKKKDGSGELIYSGDDVYDYLEHVRQMGMEQVFRTDTYGSDS